MTLFSIVISFFSGTIPFSDATASAFVKNYGSAPGAKKKVTKGAGSGFSEEHQQRNFGVTAQAFTKCRRHPRGDATVEDPLRPGKVVPWSYVDPTSDNSFRYLTWARFVGRCFFCRHSTSSHLNPPRKTSCSKTDGGTQVGFPGWRGSGGGY